MTQRPRLELDTLLHHLALVGFIALTTWTLVGLFGTVGGYLEVNRWATLWFLLAVLLLVSAPEAFIRVREHHLRRLPPDERYGFGH
jgi:hypothetical protein